MMRMKTRTPFLSLLSLNRNNGRFRVNRSLWNAEHVVLSVKSSSLSVGANRDSSDQIRQEAS
jgi:hypothetical protein